MLIPFHEWSLFALAAFIMVLSPGPNMMYLVSRSLCQGTRAAELSLLGVAAGFVLHLGVAAFGLTAFFLAVPYAYDALKYLGAAYLLWLAWQNIRPGSRGLFETQDLPPDSAGRLFWMGFFTNALNPKIAMFYISIFTQFLNPEHGSILGQSIILGFTQIIISMTVNYIIIQCAGAVSIWFNQQPLWSRVQRGVMATVLSGLAVKLALSERK